MVPCPGTHQAWHREARAARRLRDIASVVAFLPVPAAAGINGQVLRANGGMV
jgi:NAD(P)-dependent dehydrogenase (short-subunit alcohol dehydrogenase family)